MKIINRLSFLISLLPLSSYGLDNTLDSQWCDALINHEYELCVKDTKTNPYEKLKKLGIQAKNSIDQAHNLLLPALRKSKFKKDITKLEPSFKLVSNELKNFFLFFDNNLRVTKREVEQITSLYDLSTSLGNLAKNLKDEGLEVDYNPLRHYFKETVKKLKYMKNIMNDLYNGTQTNKDDCEYHFKKILYPQCISSLNACRDKIKCAQRFCEEVAFDASSCPTYGWGVAYPETEESGHHFFHSV